MAILGIEASNIGSGGGITHLREILKCANPTQYGFEKVILWASDQLLEQIQNKSWLEKRQHPYLNRSIFHRTIWQKFVFPKEAKEVCDVLFLPAGNNIDFYPYVSICQNLLPFDAIERARYGFSLMRIRLKLLQQIQKACYARAKGMIFLSQHSLNLTEQLIPNISNKSIIIPHAADSEMFRPNAEDNQPKQKLKILYVSTIDVYKHQDTVAKAVLELINEGYSLELTLVGGKYPASYNKLLATLNVFRGWENHVHILTQVSFNELPTIYAQADIFVLASTCETFGIILLEAMCSGLPILCAYNPTLEETLEDNGLYFNALDHTSLKTQLIKLINNPTLRHELSLNSIRRSKEYTWQKSSEMTFEFISKTLNS